MYVFLHLFAFPVVVWQASLFLIARDQGILLHFGVGQARGASLFYFLAAVYVTSALGPRTFT